MLYTLHFFSSKCSLFHNANLFGSCIIHILYTECAKIKNNNSGAKELIQNIHSSDTFFHWCWMWKFMTTFSNPTYYSPNTGNLTTHSLMQGFKTMKNRTIIEKLWRIAYACNMNVNDRYFHLGAINYSEIKLTLCTPYMSRRMRMAKWTYSCKYPYPQRCTEASSKLHVPAALPPKNYPQVPTKQQAVWVQR